MKNPALIAAAGLLAFGAWRLNQNAQSLTIEDISGAVQDLGDNIVSKTVNALGLWRAPSQYAGLIAQAETSQGIPATMLERLLYQECRYRADIISGATRSPVGALGIAQFMPATAAEMGINPLDPKQAIPAAAKYLAGLYRKFGNWTEALAAYNWGQGNVQRKGIAAAPRETRNYYSQILADVNSTSGTAYA
jgi:soluble lytic murein transglycosylase-like protein